MAKVKDRPLRLRVRQDGKEYLDDTAWPPRHEFSLDWLFDHSEDVEEGVPRVAASDGKTITVTLANASAKYKILAKPGDEPIDVDGEPRAFTGYWCKLIEGRVD